MKVRSMHQPLLKTTDRKHVICIGTRGATEDDRSEGCNRSGSAALRTSDYGLRRSSRPRLSSARQAEDLVRDRLPRRIGSRWSSRAACTGINATPRKIDTWRESSCCFDYFRVMLIFSCECVLTSAAFCDYFVVEFDSFRIEVSTRARLG